MNEIFKRKKQQQQFSGIKIMNGIMNAIISNFVTPPEHCFKNLDAYIICYLCNLFKIFRSLQPNL